MLKFLFFLITKHKCALRALFISWLQQKYNITISKTISKLAAIDNLTVDTKSRSASRWSISQKSDNNKFRYMRVIDFTPFFRMDKIIEMLY